jgi:signal transduction histidine kinase
VSRGKENEFLPSDINNIVKEYVWLSYHAMRANDKSFNISIHEDYQVDIPKLMVIPQDLSRAILNLMNNACYAVHKRAENEGDDYTPTINVKTSLADGMLTITIADNGEGMSDEVKQRLFENFFTTKPVGKGTGLGMAIVRDIVEQKHGGKLSFESTLGSGTIFTITIPEKKS